MPYSKTTAVSIALPYGCEHMSAPLPYQYISFEKEYINKSFADVYDLCTRLSFDLTMLDELVFYLFIKFNLFALAM